jgi:hypothetical protein
MFTSHVRRPTEMPTSSTTSKDPRTIARDAALVYLGFGVLAYDQVLDAQREARDQLAKRRDDVAKAVDDFVTRLTPYADEARDHARAWQSSLRDRLQSVRIESPIRVNGAAKKTTKTSGAKQTTAKKALAKKTTAKKTAAKRTTAKKSTTRPKTTARPATRKAKTTARRAA